MSSRALLRGMGMFAFLAVSGCDRSGAYLNPNANVHPEDAAALGELSDTPVGTASALATSPFAAGQIDAGSISVPRGTFRETLAFEAASACFVDNTTTVHCFGRRPTDLAPIVDHGAIPFYGATSAIAAMNDALCALSASGRVECIGRGAAGQIGDGALKDQTKPIKVLDGAAQLVAGMGHACVRFGDGRIACWGGDVRSDAETKSDHACDFGPCLPQPVFFPLKNPAVTIAAGRISVCAIEKDGSAECFGAPALPKNLPPLRDFALGGSASCALAKSGDVWCWGKNDVIQTGVAGPDLRTDAVRVPLPGKAVEIASESVSTCARLTSGVVQCWGANALGQLGRGSATAGIGAPPGAATLPGPARALTGNGAFCAALDHSIVCWGSQPWSTGPRTNPTEPAVDGKDFVSKPTEVPDFAAALGH